MKTHVLSHISNHIDPHKKNILIYDNCSVYTKEDVLENMENRGIKYLFLPPDTTSVLQPLDLSTNKSLKRHVRDYFKAWLADGIEEYLNENNEKKYKFKRPNRK